MAFVGKQLIAGLMASTLLLLLAGCSDDDVAKARFYCQVHMDDCSQALAELQKIVGDQKPPTDGDHKEHAAVEIHWVNASLLFIEGTAPATEVHLVLVQGDRVLAEADAQIKGGRLEASLSVPEGAGSNLAVLLVDKGTKNGLGRFEVPARPDPAPPSNSGGGATNPPAPPKGAAEPQNPQASLKVIRWTSGRGLHVEGQAPDGVANLKLLVVSGSRVLTQAEAAVKAGRFSVDISLPESSGKGLAILVTNSATNKSMGRFEVPSRP